MIPETVSQSQMISSRIRLQKELENLKNARAGIPLEIFTVIKRIFRFLSPLVLFMPEGQNVVKGRRDWTLTLLAAGYGMTVMTIVSALSQREC